MLAALALAPVAATAAPPAGAGAASATTGAGDAPSGGVLQPLPGLDPELRRMSSAQARVAAAGDDRFRAEALERGIEPQASDLRARFNEHTRTWEVDLLDADGVAVVRADVPDISGAVREVWTGHAIGWTMARGNARSFGGSINDPWLWWSLTGLFVVMLLRLDRLRSVHTLDLAMLVSFGISHELFRAGMVEWSVPLAVPPLLWVLGRSLHLAARAEHTAPMPAPRPAGRWTTLLARWPPTPLVLVVTVFALGLRYGLHWQDSTVIDVGYAGVIGADLLLAGESPYGNMPSDNPHGDTYGPLNYAAYVPAVLIWGFSGSWDTLLAAHAVAIASDVLCLVLLVVLGRQLRSWRAGLLAACAWTLYPWTTMAMNSSSNDALVAALLLAALVALGSPLLRGALVAAASMVKFLPVVALAAVLHVGRASMRRQVTGVAAGAALVLGACAAWLARLDGGLPAFWEASVAFQAGRDSPFSIHGLWGMAWTAWVARVLAVVVLVLACLWPRPRRRPQVLALVAATIAAAQLALQHWFYLYLPWLVAPLLVLIAVRHGQPRAGAGAGVGRASGR